MLMLCHGYSSAQPTNVPATATFRTHRSVLVTNKHILWKIKVTTKMFDRAGLSVKSVA